MVVYVLKNPQNKLYIGQTNNLERRLSYHNAGRNTYTARAGGPWKVVYTETYPTRSEAMKREKELKTGKGREFLNKYRIENF